MAAGPASAIAADAIYTQINCSPVLDETLAACPQLFDTVSDDRDKRAPVEIYPNAYGFFKCAIQHDLPRISLENRSTSTLISGSPESDLHATSG